MWSKVSLVKSLTKKRENKIKKRGRGGKVHRSPLLCTPMVTGLVVSIDSSSTGLVIQGSLGVL